jgi:Ca2+-binding RTX toxin-like protein
VTFTQNINHHNLTTNGLMQTAAYVADYLSNSSGRVQIYGADLFEIEVVELKLADDTSQVVRILGAGGYSAWSDIIADSDSTDIIYVADHSYLESTDAITFAGNEINLVIGDGAEGSVAYIKLSNSGSINIFGHQAFSLSGSTGADTVNDYTSLASGSNLISGGLGNDILISHNGTTSVVMYGDGGDDMLIGGMNDQLYGGNGNDTLLAFEGNAYLSGGAGSDLLVNSYLALQSSSQSVVMIGGSGNDTFSLMGTGSIIPEPEGTNMSTTIADLASGEMIDLSFLEKNGAVLNSSGLNGTATIAGSSVSVNLSNFTLTSTDGDDVAGAEFDLDNSKLLISNASLTKVSTAITAGFASAPQHNFDSIFAPLTDHYDAIR